MAALTSLRQGELLALRWEHVDLGGGEIDVVASARGRKGERVALSQPKTPDSVRSVDARCDGGRGPKGAEGGLAGVQGQVAARLQGPGFVFTDQLGGPLPADWVTRVWNRSTESWPLRHPVS